MSSTRTESGGDGVTTTENDDVIVAENVDDVIVAENRRGKSFSDEVTYILNRWLFSNFNVSLEFLTLSYMV